jgi:transposase
MAITLPDARQLSDEVLESLRLRALRACELGYTETEVAEFLGLARETVCRWWSAYAEQGLEALPHERTGRPLGSGRTLTDTQAKHLQDLLDHQTPEQLGIASPLWTRRAVRDLILKEYAITMPVRTVGQYLHRWGYTRKKARRHAQDQDPEEIRHWLEETYPALEKRAAAEDAEIHWCDETGVAADEHPGYGYARQGQLTQAEVPDSHIRVNMISTITNEGAVHFMTYQETMTAALFIVFLSRLVQEVHRKVFLITDRLKAHDAAAVQAWVAAHQDQIEVLLLPPYAPEYNGDEYLNNDLKGEVNAAGLPRNKRELGSHITAFMQKLMQLPERVRNYFQHPCMQYAAGQ